MTLLADDLPVLSAAVGRADDIFFIGMEKDRPQELYRKKNGVLKKLSSFNASYVKSREIGETTHFTFKDREGTELDGFVLLPPDYDPEKRYPGILTVHGGPRYAYGLGFFHEFQYFAGKGYVVFFCNPPGGSGKGDAFADILGDKFGVRDYNALMDFTDEVLKRYPSIDPERIGMTGGSYGGFMANWIIGHTDRFKAVVSCRGISNYFSKSLTTDVGYYHNFQQLKTDPWKDPATIWSHSPLAYADKVKTPTLFTQSDEDYRCWMGDAVQMLQALMLHGVPTRMCLFHGESHGLSRTGKPKHRVRRLKEMAAWFDKYLAG
jgi:dipeptidyl aminopeptidase/acylaminoacyl peptidase